LPDLERKREGRTGDGSRLTAVSAALPGLRKKGKGREKEEERGEREGSRGSDDGQASPAQESAVMKERKGGGGRPEAGAVAAGLRQQKGKKG